MRSGISVRAGGRVRALSLGAVAALALLATGCSSGDDETTGAPTPPAVSTPAAATTAANATAGAPADRDLNAADYVLTAGPATEGFADGGPGAPSTEDDTAANHTEVASCVGVAGYHSATATDSATGHSFSQEGGVPSIDSSARVLPSAQVEQDVAIVTHAVFARCLGTLAEKAFTAQAGPGVTLTLGDARALPTPKGATAAVRFSVTQTDASGTYSFVVDDIFVYAGQVEVDVTYLGLEAPSAVTEQAIVDQLAAKVAGQ